jgi:putative peptidoglycan lipid II flippase
VLWLGMKVLAGALARADLVGAAALLGLCALGAAVYGVAGALLGIIRLSELRSMIRRPRAARPDVKPADPDGQP